MLDLTSVLPVLPRKKNKDRSRGYVGESRIAKVSLQLGERRRRFQATPEIERTWPDILRVPVRFNFEGRSCAFHIVTKLYHHRNNNIFMLVVASLLIPDEAGRDVLLLDTS